MNLSHKAVVTSDETYGQQLHYDNKLCIKCGDRNAEPCLTPGIVKITYILNVYLCLIGILGRRTKI